VGFCADLANLSRRRPPDSTTSSWARREIAALSDAAFDEALGRIREAGVAVPATNLFLPATSR
jgi:hypothetical protein